MTFSVLQSSVQLDAPCVLIADDDVSICTILRQALTRKGYHVQVAEDGQELVEWVMCGRGNVIISDVVMPRMSGLDALDEIRRINADIPVIIMSAKSTLMTALEATKRGAQEYFPKPFDLHALIACVERLAPKYHDVAAQLHASATRLGGDTSQGDVHLEDISLVGKSPAMQETFRTIARLVSVDLTVMLRGESGTGKEVIARVLHQMGTRKHKPFIALNMAAIARDLVESELFGHEKGAFTGASTMRQGAFAQAEGGTLFLDEIGDMPFEAQTRLLRVLQEGEFTPVGGTKPIKSNVRIICATHQDMEVLCKKGVFREDLYYRINVVPITIPPLRERREDISDLAAHFLKKAEQRGLPKKILMGDALEMLQGLPWRGNIRELENMIYRLCALIAQPHISADIIGTCIPSLLHKKKARDAHALLQDNEGEIEASTKDFTTIETVAQRALMEYFSAHGCNMPPTGLYQRMMSLLEIPLLVTTLNHVGGNQVRAADILGINRNTLRAKMQLYGIERTTGKTYQAKH